ncbi:MAG TPA: LacI family DNA-binding transcriptional regulator [Micromonosporaceae bacterium]|nr:LacI family DNA-binding transcriptional regulator [Micromonosporaceae bacterium]
MDSSRTVAREAAPGRAVMHDVARLAGVSHQTVSRVINGHPNVRESTRVRVLRAMRQLDYRPNALARGLATRRSRTIGVLGFDAELYGPSSTLLGIQRAAQEEDYAVNVVTLSEKDATGSVARAVGMLAEQSVEGVIVIAPSNAAADAVRDLPRGLPVLALEASFGRDMRVVVVDQYTGATLATRHLLDLGHRTVWHITGPSDWPEAVQRIDGWHATLDAAGASAPQTLTGDWSARSGYEAGRRLAAVPDVTAVFVANDQMALGVLHALHEAGIPVPGQVSVVGFDDMPEAEYFLPALTTVRQDFNEVGRCGLRTMLEMIDGSEVAAETRVTPTLVVRASSARPPA